MQQLESFVYPHQLFVMSFFRIKTVNGKSYLYRQTSIRKGKKVKSKMEYLGALGFIGWAAASPGYIGSKGHKSTDKRVLRDQDAADRERFKKEMERPQERFKREAGKAASVRSGKANAAPDPEMMKEVREFNERRAAGFAPEQLR
jgi:hypothetical protein